MAKETDLKKKVEGVFGKELAPEMLEKIRWSHPVATYDFTPADNAYVTTVNLILPGKSCTKHALFDISGWAATGSDGKRVFRLSEFACYPQWHGQQMITFDHPINAVATPVSSEPYFVTLKHALLPDSLDVEITVFAWDTNGDAAPNIAFNWRCRVPYWQVVL